MYSSWSEQHQAEMDYRRDRIRAGIGPRPSRRRLRHRAPRSGPGGAAGRTGTDN